MLTSDVNCLFTPRSEENNGKKTEIIDQPRFHADTHSTSQKCPLISSLTPLFDSTNYLALFRSYQRAIIHCQTFSVARGERNAHFSVLSPRLNNFLSYNAFVNKFNIKTNYLEYLKVISATTQNKKVQMIPLALRNASKDKNENLLSHSKICKNIYQYRVEKKASAPTKSQRKWLAEDIIAGKIRTH